jgi:hypothetical protein
MLQGETEFEGADLGWPGYNSVTIVRNNGDTLYIEGSDIQPYDPTTFPDGAYPF